MVMDVLVFRAGEARWGVDVTRVQEILDVATVMPLPELPEWMRGVMDHRGTLVPVVDFRILSGSKPAGRDATLIVSAGDRDVAITVDGVESTESVDLSALVPDAGRPWAIGVADDLAILDTANLMEVQR